MLRKNNIPYYENIIKEVQKMNIRNVLNDEIESEFEALSEIEIGSDTYKTTVDGLAKLVDKAIELERLDAEMDDKADNRETDLDFKRQQMQTEKRAQIVRNGIAIAGIVIPTAVTVWGTLKSLKFENAGGIISTDAGRNFISRIFKK